MSKIVVNVTICKENKNNEELNRKIKFQIFFMFKKFGLKKDVLDYRL